MDISLVIQKSQGMLTSQKNVQGLKSEILKSLGTKDSKSYNTEAKRHLLVK